MMCKIPILKISSDGTVLDGQLPTTPRNPHFCFEWDRMAILSITTFHGAKKLATVSTYSYFTLIVTLYFSCCSPKKRKYSKSNPTQQLKPFKFMSISAGQFEDAPSTSKNG